MSELPAQDSPNDAPDADIAPIVDDLAALDPSAVKAVLDRKLAETHAVDPSAGILIAPLEGAEPRDLNGQTFRFYGARILPAGTEAPNYVIPHVHQVGVEPYYIFEGTGGEMNTGRIEEGRVIWNAPRTVLPGEAIVIEEGQVHSLRNTGETDFDFAFASPDSHLVDKNPEQPKGDRVFTTNLENPLPPHYPQPSV